MRQSSYRRRSAPRFPKHVARQRRTHELHELCVDATMWIRPLDFSDAAEFADRERSRGKKIFDTGYAMGVQDAENESMGVTNCQSMSMLCRDSGILINVSMRP